jgi:hypothetical protein
VRLVDERRILNVTQVDAVGLAGQYGDGLHRESALTEETAGESRLRVRGPAASTR